MYEVYSALIDPQQLFRDLKEFKDLYPIAAQRCREFEYIEYSMTEEVYFLFLMKYPQYQGHI